jgi:hypothetical protein
MGGSSNAQGFSPPGSQAFCAGTDHIADARGGFSAQATLTQNPSAPEFIMFQRLIREDCSLLEAKI